MSFAVRVPAGQPSEGGGTCQTKEEAEARGTGSLGRAEGLHYVKRVG